MYWRGSVQRLLVNSQIYVCLMRKFQTRVNNYFLIDLIKPSKIRSAIVGKSTVIHRSEIFSLLLSSFGNNKLTYKLAWNVNLIVYEMNSNGQSFTCLKDLFLTLILEMGRIYQTLLDSACEFRWHICCINNPRSVAMSTLHSSLVFLVSTNRIKYDT